MICPWQYLTAHTQENPGDFLGGSCQGKGTAWRASARHALPCSILNISSLFKGEDGG